LSGKISIDSASTEDISPKVRSPYLARIIIGLLVLLGPLITVLLLQYTVIRYLRYNVFRFLPFYDDILFQTLFNIVYELIAIVLFLALIFFDIRTTTLQDMGITKPAIPKSNGWLISTFAFGFFAASGYLIIWVAFLFPLPLSFNLFTFTNLLMLVLFLLVGISEEFYFRGYLFANSSKIFGLHFAPIFVNILFAAIHIPKFVIGAIFAFIDYPNIMGMMDAIYMMVQMVIGLNQIFAIGLILTYYRNNLKIIWASVMAHAFYDFWISFFIPSDTSLMYTVPLAYLLFALVGIFMTYATLFGAWILSSRVFKVLSHEEVSYKIRNVNKKLQKKIEKIAITISRLQDIRAQTTTRTSRVFLEKRIKILQARKELFEKIMENAKHAQEKLTLTNANEVFASFKQEEKMIKKKYNLRIRSIKIKEHKQPTVLKQEKIIKISKCPACGHDIEEEAKFCAYCGKNL